MLFYRRQQAQEAGSAPVAGRQGRPPERRALDPKGVVFFPMSLATAELCARARTPSQSARMGYSRLE
jgi:hypothetical protein